MPHLTQARIDSTFSLITAAVLNNQKCPSNEEGIESAALTRLAKTGWIKVEYSSNNYRRIYVLKGQYAGQSTAPDPKGNLPYATQDHTGIQRKPENRVRQERNRATPSLPKLSFLEEKEI